MKSLVLDHTSSCNQLSQMSLLIYQANLGSILFRNRRSSWSKPGLHLRFSLQFHQSIQKYWKIKFLRPFSKQLERLWWGLFYYWHFHEFSCSYIKVFYVKAVFCCNIERTVVWSIFLKEILKNKATSSSLISLMQTQYWCRLS